MDSLGEYLKRERELRGITLRYISDVTKIHIKYLEALEENHFEILPAEAFTRGFLRSYAKCVGIDPDEAVLVYKQSLDRLKGSSIPSIPAVASEPLHSPQVQAPTAPQEKVSSAGSPKLVITLFSLFMVLGVAFYAFVSSRAKRGLETAAVEAPKAEPTQKAPTISTPKEEASAGAKARPLEAETKAVPPAASGYPLAGYPLPGAAERRPAAENQAPKNLALTINAKEKTWIQAVVDGTERREALLPAGSQVTWRAANQFVLVIGNVKGTEMTLNGTEIHVPEGQQNVLRDFVVTREFIR